LIWVKPEGDSFSERDWTGQITLNRFDKLVESRTVGTTAAEW